MRDIKEINPIYLSARISLSMYRWEPGDNSAWLTLGLLAHTWKIGVNRKGRRVRVLFSHYKHSR